MLSQTVEPRTLELLKSLMKSPILKNYQRIIKEVKNLDFEKLAKMEMGFRN